MLLNDLKEIVDTLAYSNPSNIRLKHNYNLFYAAISSYIKMVSSENKSLSDLIKIIPHLNVGFGNNLFTDGFCDLEDSLIETFTNTPGIRWGGTYNTKIDGMHFEYNDNKRKELGLEN